MAQDPRSNNRRWNVPLALDIINKPFNHSHTAPENARLDTGHRIGAYDGCGLGNVHMWQRCSLECKASRLKFTPGAITPPM